MPFHLNLQDPAVQSALIGALGAIVTALIAGLIGQRLSGRKRLAEKLLTAQKDIEFLLLVEAAHCEIHQSQTGASQKISVRKRVREQGHSWSGKFTPGRLLHPEFEQHRTV